MGTAQTGTRGGNYEIVVEDGTVTVNPAKLEITAESVTTWPGVTPDFTGTTITEIVRQFVNGDQLVNVDLGYGLKDNSVPNALGH